jgi:hypothetical protein
MTCALSATAAHATNGSSPKSAAQPGTKGTSAPDLAKPESLELRPLVFWPRPRRRLATTIRPRIERQIHGRSLPRARLLNSTRRVLVYARIVRPRGAARSAKPLSACSLSQARWCIRGRRNGAHVHPRDRPRGQTGLRGAEHAPRLEGGLSRLRLDRVDPPSSANRGRHAAPLARASVTSRWRQTVFRLSPHRPDALESRPRGTLGRRAVGSINLGVSRHCLRSNRISFLRKSTTQYYETKKMIATAAATTFVCSTSLVPISQATFPMWGIR